MSLALREAVRGFERAPTLSVLSVVTIAFSLFAFGLFGLVALNLRNALELVEDRVEVRGFVAQGTPPEATSAAVGDVQMFPEVLSVRLVTESQALERARRELREFQDVFDAGVLPASIEIKMRPGMHDPETVRTVARRLEMYDFIDDVRYGEEWVENLHRIRNIAMGAGLALGLVFAIVSIIIIGSTIRMTVLARTREIQIMRLVGATDGFIRAPFVIEGLLKGTLGGLIALVLTWAVFEVSGRWILQVTYFDATLAMAGLAGGALIGMLGSALAVGRHLRQV